MTTSTLRPTDRSITGDMVRIAVGKGCALYLTPTEANAIARGKRIRRAEQHQRRASTPTEANA